jgi:hypothetical protein
MYGRRAYSRPVLLSKRTHFGPLDRRRLEWAGKRHNGVLFDNKRTCLLR